MQEEHRGSQHRNNYNVLRKTWFGGPLNVSYHTMPGQEDDFTIKSIPIRRFVVQPVETTSSSHRSSRKKVADTAIDAGTAPKRRFLPQPEETSVKSNRKARVNARRDSDSEDDKPVEVSPTISREGSNGERQFIPQLVETVKRSRKIGDDISSLQQIDKTDFSPGDRTYQPRHIRLPSPPVSVSDDSSVDSSDKTLQIPESRFSYASLSGKKPEKRRSFRVPALESIASTGDSDESEELNVPSLSTTPSIISSEEVDVQRRVHRLHAESHDENDKKISGYILSLAATAVKKQLQDQALAAFPNERQHQPVSHFAIDEDSAGSDEEEAGDGHFKPSNDPDFFQRRMSAAGWDVLEMQKHKEMLEEQRRQQKLVDERSHRKSSNTDPWSNPYDIGTLRIGRLEAETEARSVFGGGVLRDTVEVTKMRHAASPPMLGADLRFPKSLSPQHTMMDPTQRPVCWKRSKSHGLQSRQNSGLWTPHGDSPISTRKNTETIRHDCEDDSSPGLWGGFCQAPEHHNSPLTISPKKSKKQSGLMTPSHEKADPFSPASTPIPSPYHQLPITPNLIPQIDIHLEGIDSVLQLEATIDDEYPDSFITQVYNYLSLGYPALARDYDNELSKISRVPIDDIRRGDDRVDSKGHIGAPESEGWDERKCMEECGRWTALRLYVREWARQQPKFMEDHDQREAARARRGSWGV